MQLWALVTEMLNFVIGTSQTDFVFTKQLSLYCLVAKTTVTQLFCVFVA